MKDKEFDKTIIRLSDKRKEIERKKEASVVAKIVKEANKLTW